ncbi:uncharacterized protein FPOAC1_013245 [Fusarium poae]|uniref:uncharacterized protein n=1 Tax=Fusarium poae TaxID=36050 RepID=UPI001D041840|nr:uncharacterized protein FPOAC1_013245 [Fusarium poae]KAG8665266.1 hypothetical protein FPOAC1_013245 [Fusarium poae]
MAPKKTRSRSPDPNDRARVSSAMRKRGNTAIKKNYKFGKDCGTIAVLLFYNKIHGFWDGSVYTPPGESLPENTDELIRDVERRQVVSNHNLVLRPARQRKQQDRAKPCKVTKSYKATKPAPRPSPRVRSLRSRRRPGDGSPVPGASPAQPQITVAGDESESEDEDEDEDEDEGGDGDDGASVWDVPRSPAPRETQRRSRRGRRSVRSDADKPVARRQNDAAPGTYAVDPVRVAERTNDHVSDDDEGGDYKQKHRGQARRARGRNRRRGFDDQGEPAEPNRNAASHHLGDHEVAHEQSAAIPYTSMEDGDAEGEPWGEPTAPLAPMGTAGPMDAAVDMAHCDEVRSMDMTTGTEDDAWMHSAIMEFGDMADMPGAQHWGDMLEFDADNIDMHMDVDLDMGLMDQFGNGQLAIDMMGLPSAGPGVVPAVSTEVGGNQDDLGLVQGDGGDANGDGDADGDADVNADADAGNGTIKMLQPSAVTASGSRVFSTQSSDGALGVQAQRLLDETHPSPRSIGVPGWPDTLEHTTTAVKDGERPARFAGNQLLAIIAKALSQMDSYGDVEPDIGDKSCWPMQSRDMIGMPFAMPAC